MKKLGKALLWIIAIILLFYGVAALTLHYLIKPTTYKTLIQNTVYKYTGYNVSINGGVDWSLFPNPRLKLTDLVVANPQPNNVSPYFIKVDEIDVGIKLSPLFSAKVVPGHLVVRDANINLVYQTAKNNSFSVAKDKLKNQSSSMKVEPQKSVKDTITSEKNMLRNFTLPKITIINSNIKWIDLKTKQVTSFNGINLLVNPNLMSTEIKGNVTVQQKNTYYQIKLAGNLNTSADNAVLKFENFKINGNMTQGNARANTFNYSGDVALDLDKNSIEIANYKLTFNNLPMTGSIKDTWTVTNTGLSSTFNMLTKIQDGLINETGQLSIPDSGLDGLRYTLNMTNLPIAPVLKAIYGNSSLDGYANVKANLTGTNAGNNWLRNINGTGSFSLEKGKLLNVHAFDYLNTALNTLHRTGLVGRGRSNEGTVFTTLRGSFAIQNGIFLNRDLNMTSPNIQATGAGNINLVSNTINYRLLIKDSAAADLIVPVNIVGNLADPKVSADYGSITTQILKQNIKSIFNGKILKRIF